MEGKVPLEPPCPHHHDRRGNGYRNRGFVLCCLSLILLLVIPLCLFMFMEQPKLVVIWWTDPDTVTPASLRPAVTPASLRPAVTPANLRPAGTPKTSNFQKENIFAKEKAKRSDLPKALLISYDGFRWDYIQNNNNTPTFRWLIANGVFAAEGLKNTYITITAPNHYALVTGLYEESHGIVANEFFAPEFNETIDYFNQRMTTDPRVFGGEPIWVTNDKAGQGRASGCQMWTGCDVVIKGRLPNHYTSWDGDLSWIVRVDSIINWFKEPDNPINLGLLYIEEPDETGHENGPDDPRTAAMVQKLDQLTAYLLNRLHAEDLLDKVNLIFTADHGMAAVPWLNVVPLDQYVNSSLYTVYGGTPNWNVLPKPGAEQIIYDALYNKVPHLSVYNKSTIPQDYHYTNTPHVLPLQFVADIHWNLAHHNNSLNSNGERIYQRKTRGKLITRKLEADNSTVGEHGYNNSLTDMHPYFIGYGPAFKQGYNASQFFNIDVYPLMCYILGVTPAPNNGSLDRVRSILKDEGRPYRARLLSKNRPKMRFDEQPPWMEAFDRSGFQAEKPSLANGKVVAQVWPVSYSINFDILVMTILFIIYVTIMIFLSERVRRALRRDHHQSAHECARCKESKSAASPFVSSNGHEKCQIIDVVA